MDEKISMDGRISIEKRDVREAMVEMETAKRQILHPYFQDLGLSPGQPRILNKLYEKDHVTQRELADKCFMDVATMSRNLDRLEEAGYITREKHPDCRRSFLIVLTKEGRNRAAQVYEDFRLIDEKIWQGFTEEEMAVFLSCAKKIIGNLKSETEKTPESPGN